MEISWKTKFVRRSQNETLNWYVITSSRQKNGMNDLNECIPTWVWLLDLLKNLSVLQNKIRRVLLLMNGRAGSHDGYINPISIWCWAFTDDLYSNQLINAFSLSVLTYSTYMVTKATVHHWTLRPMTDNFTRVVMIAVSHTTCFVFYELAICVLIFEISGCSYSEAQNPQWYMPSNRLWQLRALFAQAFLQFESRMSNEIIIWLVKRRRLRMTWKADTQTGFSNHAMDQLAASIVMN